jgi:hypothetical protein
VLIVLASAGFRYWQYVRQRATEAAGDQFQQALTALEGGKVDEAKAGLDKIAAQGPSGYRALWQMTAAGDEAPRTRGARSAPSTPSRATARSIHCLGRHSDRGPFGLHASRQPAEPLLIVPALDIIGGSTVLSFKGSNDPTLGIDWNLDDVSVTASAVPEPATWILLALAFAGLAIQGRLKAKPSRSLRA